MKPTVVTIEVSDGVCHYETSDAGHPVVVRFKDYDNIEAGDPDVWSYNVLNTRTFIAD